MLALLNRRTTPTLALWLAGVALLLAPGCCSGVRIPAFDPTGERIFSGSGTTLNPNLLNCSLLNRNNNVPLGTGVPCATTPPPCQPGFALPAAPTGAFPIPTGCAATQGPAPVVLVPTAPQVTICAPDQPNCPANQAPPGPQLKLVPGQIVAPVGSEVVLAAGLCGPNGHYVTRQPLEWMLNPDGVGQIVQVGQEVKHPITGIFSSTPQKVVTNFARAKTSSVSQTITRGTPTTADDLSLAKGQSWVSVTSPTEGATHVTCVAPKEGNWDQRKQTATIYWVDSRWTLPPCTVVRAGTKHLLVTRLVRSNGAPVVGWIVRYEFIEGPDASFGAGQEKYIEVTSRADGTAVAELLPSTLEPGITLVKVQIIRPQTKGDLPNMIVGQGVASITWSAPGLNVRVLGSENVAVNGLVSYRVEVMNTGDTPAPGVTLSYTPPVGVALLNSNPPHQPFGQRVQWNLGDLPPRAVAVVELNCRANRAADGIRSTFVAQSADNLQAEGSASTRVFASQLAVDIKGPATAEVGEKVQFAITVRNTGSVPLTNVLVSDQFEAGLRHLAGERSPILKELGNIEPGQAQQFAATFVADQAGKLCNRVEVAAEGGHTAAASACVIVSRGAGVAPQVPPSQGAGQVQLLLTGPPQIVLGALGDYTIQVFNKGQTAVEGLQLDVQLPPSLQGKQATKGYVAKDDLITWTIDRLEAGSEKSFRLTGQSLTADSQGIVRAVLSGNRIERKVADFSTRIVAPAVIQPRTSAPPPNRPLNPPPATSGNSGAADNSAAGNAGNLRVALDNTNNPVRQGERTTYVMVIENRGQTADEEISLRLILPAGLKFERLVESTGKLKIASASGAAIDITPIATLRAGEKTSEIRLEFSATKPGKQVLQVQISSRQNPAGIVAQQETTVNQP